jgi:hypothetical protein
LIVHLNLSHLQKHLDFNHICLSLQFSGHLWLCFWLHGIYQQHGCLSSSLLLLKVNCLQAQWFGNTLNGETLQADKTIIIHKNILASLATGGQ